MNWYIICVCVFGFELVYLCVCIQFKCTWMPLCVCMHVQLFLCICAVMVFDGRIYCFEALKVSLSADSAAGRSSNINTFVVLGCDFFSHFFLLLLPPHSPSAPFSISLPYPGIKQGFGWQ